MDNWTKPKYNFKKHTSHDSPWWQPTEAKIKNQAGVFVFDKFSLQVNLGDESGGVQTSLLNILFLNTSQVNSTMRPSFIIQTSERICSFFALFNL